MLSIRMIGGAHRRASTHSAPRRRLTAREMEAQAAAAQAVAPAPLVPAGEAMAMLARRGFRADSGRPDLPFPLDLEPAIAERLTERLGHYSFRLFLRGAIQRRGDFAPEEATRYLSASQAKALADALVEMGILIRAPRDRYRFLRPATSFGGALEWYVARELHRRLGCNVATGVKFGARGLGGDLDVVAAAEGKLIYLELKSSPPKHLTRREVTAFFARLRTLRPDVAVFAMDTALRLSDRVLPLLVAELTSAAPAPRRIERDLWAITPHLYAVSAKPDLAANVCRAVAEGLLALGPIT
jgi:hypothetical protein